MIRKKERKKREIARETRNLFSKDSKIRASMIRKKEKFFEKREIHFEKFQNSSFHDSKERKRNFTLKFL